MVSARDLNIRKYVFTLTLVLAVLLPGATSQAVVCQQPTERSFGERMSDGFKSSRIETAYLFDRNLNTFDVDVDVVGSIAYVHGYVPTEAERDHALKLAKETPGIKDAVDLLIVDPYYKMGPSEERTAGQTTKDFWTAKAIKTELLASPRVRGSSVGTMVRDGVVTLRGSVKDLEQKQAAEEIASRAEGVKTVKNEIIVVC
ncbi:MAG: BON domain-containing protein [Candidatus Lindowbacteria bacterium]|nr:BON domain-containing protein [Candidatus Lindowbacteria bacterium]